ncbi:hypothetical protein DUNSADRAFT_4712, partial [Dunaliella salina]
FDPRCDAFYLIIIIYAEYYMSTRRQEGMRRKSVFSRPVVHPYLLGFFFLLHLVDGHQSAHLKPHGAPDGYAFSHKGLVFDLQEDYMILELRELMEADPDSAGLHKHAPEEAVPDQSRALRRFLQASAPVTYPPSYPAYPATYPSPEPLFPGTYPPPPPSPEPLFPGTYPPPPPSPEPLFPATYPPHLLFQATYPPSPEPPSPSPSLPSGPSPPSPQ